MRILEKLYEMDKQSFNEETEFHNLTALYEAAAPRLTSQDKVELKDLLNSTNDPNMVSAFLQTKELEKESLEEECCEEDLGKFVVAWKNPINPVMEKRGFESKEEAEEFFNQLQAEGIDAELTEVEVKGDDELTEGIYNAKVSDKAYYPEIEAADEEEAETVALNYFDEREHKVEIEEVIPDVEMDLNEGKKSISAEEKKAAEERSKKEVDLWIADAKENGKKVSKADFMSWCKDDNLIDKKALWDYYCLHLDELNEADVHVSNIEYDISDEDAETEDEKQEIADSLPKELVVDVDNEEEIADAISNETGFLVNSFDVNDDEDERFCKRCGRVESDDVVLDAEGLCDLCHDELYMESLVHEKIAQHTGKEQMLNEAVESLKNKKLNEDWFDQVIDKVDKGEIQLDENKDHPRGFSLNTNKYKQYFRRNIGLEEDAEITEDHINDWSLKRTAGYFNVEPEEMKEYLLSK